MLKVRQNIISEEHLYIIWKHKLFNTSFLIGEKAERIAIEFQGIRNFEEGPDFKDARIWINGKLLVGDVELHIYNSDWHLHHHDENTAYRNVILHVSMWRNYASQYNNAFNITDLIIEPYLAVAIPDLINKTNILVNSDLSPQELAIETAGKSLEQAGDMRFQLKSDRFKQLLNVLDKNEVLYRGIAESLGYKNNKAQFLELSKIISYAHLATLNSINDIQNTLLYCGGFTDENPTKIKPDKMDTSLWRPYGRPTNNPKDRIKSLAKIIYTAKDEGLAKYFLNKILVGKAGVSKKAVINTILSCGIGIERSELILFNVILPFFYAHSSSDQCKNAIKYLYDIYPPLSSNVVIENGGALLFRNRNNTPKIANTFRRQMGLMQLYKENRVVI